MQAGFVTNYFLQRLENSRTALFFESKSPFRQAGNSK